MTREITTIEGHDLTVEEVAGKQTVTGAVSTTAELAVIAMVEAKTAAIEYAWLDYVAIEANRDWTE